MLERTDSGLYIVFEGIDGAGKGTQLRLAQSYLHEANAYRDILTTKEPTLSTGPGRILAERKRHGDLSDSRGDMYLFRDDREIHTMRDILPVLERDGIVLGDRYTPSTVAFQPAYENGVPRETALEAHYTSDKIIRPDLTLIFDAAIGAVHARLQKRVEGAGEKDRFEDDRSLQERVRQEYRALVHLSEAGRVTPPETGEQEKYFATLGRMVLIDASQSPEAIFEEIRPHLDAFIRPSGA